MAISHPPSLQLQSPSNHSTNLLISLAVDLGGSLAVASKGLFATGVSTDLNGWYRLVGKKISWPDEEHSHIP